MPGTPQDTPPDAPLDTLPHAPGLPPLADEFSRPYWDAARDGTLLIQRCRSCGRSQFYPRGHCAACYAPDPEWTPASGRGRLHTFTVIRRTPNAEFAADCPYVLAIIELDEGPRLTARIVGDVDDIACDRPVHVVFTPAGQTWVLPNFAVDSR